MAIYTSKKGQTVTTELSWAEALRVLSGFAPNTFAARLYDQEATYQFQCREQGTNYPRGYWPLKGDQRFWVFKLAQDHLGRQAQRQTARPAPMPAAEQRTRPESPLTVAHVEEPHPPVVDFHGQDPIPEHKPARRTRRPRAEARPAAAPVVFNCRPELLKALAAVKIDADREDVLKGYALLGAAIQGAAAGDANCKNTALELAGWLGEAGEAIRAAL